ncbi:Rne/Rng family ribonuclease [Arcanobacterium ihumii]|uniref:Rne/Rng family ribonuclease n=1 Tax=Arcanobacterium ihumii TaxID=2138162 RepID=UPI000F520A12|nr:Rne/Rng family ribonuclease [Arcanobacterium ihumii]
MAEENEARELENAGAAEKKTTRTRTAKRKTESAVTQKKSTVAKAGSKRATQKPVHENIAESVAESLAELANAKERGVSDSGQEGSAPVAAKKTRKRTTVKNAEKSEEKKPLVVTFSSGEEAVLPAKVDSVAPMTTLLFQEPDVSRAVQARRTRRKASAEVEGLSTENDDQPSQEVSADSDATTGENVRKSRRGTRGGRSADDSATKNSEKEVSSESASETSKHTRQRKRSNSSSETGNVVSKNEDEPKSSEVKPDSQVGQGVAETTTTVRRRRRRSSSDVSDEVTAPTGSTRLEAKRQRRREGREAGRRRQSISESEFLARRESVNREMLVREQNGLNQIAVIEDGVLVEHYVARHTQSSMVGNVYLGRVQNVLPSMEAAFVDIGKGRNAVLYAGEVNWEAAGMEGKPRKIEDALKSGDTVLVQVTKDPIGHKGARLTAQITLAGRHLVLVPSGAMTGISRKLPEKERIRLKKILKEVVPAEHGVIVRTAAEGATDDQLRGDVERLTKTWEDIQAKSKSTKNAPSLLKGEPELAVRVIRDVFNEDFTTLKVEGENAWNTIHEYVHELSPELEDRLVHWEEKQDIFSVFRVDEQLAKAFDRKVFLPSGGSLVIDRTEAMTVIDVNTGKFTGSGGTLEETVTRNNLEAAEEIVRQLRLRDIGGIIVIDFIDMVLEVNRDLVLRRLLECLGRDRTRHQVAEVTSLGLVQMTRKRVGQGLVEAFSTTCQACEGRGYISHDHPVEKGEANEMESEQRKSAQKKEKPQNTPDPKQAEVKAALANIAAAASHKHDDVNEAEESDDASSAETAQGSSAKQGPSEDISEAEASSNGNRSRKKRRRDASSKEGRQRGVSRQRINSREQSSVDNDVKVEEPKKADPSEVTPVVKSSGRTRRRVTSSGTITPSSSPSSAIMSFPVSKKD